MFSRAMARTCFALAAGLLLAAGDQRASLGELASSLVRSQFAGARCVVAVAPDGAGLLASLRGAVPLYSVVQRRDSPCPELALLRTLDEGCEVYLVQTGDPGRALALFADLTRRSLSRRRRNLIFLPESTGESLHQDIFATKQMDFMPDVTLVRPSKSRADSRHCDGARVNLSLLGDHAATRPKEKQRNSTELATGTDGHSQSRCDETPQVQFEIITHKFSAPDPHTSVLLATWSPDDHSSFEGELFPDKVSDLGGKQLRVASFPYMPFAIIDEQADPPLYEGIEVHIMKELARKLNFTWKFILEEENLWGNVWENGSGNGIVGSVLADESDLAFGGSYTWYEQYRVVDFSRAYCSSVILLAVPRPGLLPAWAVPALPLSAATWLGVALSLALTAAALYCVRRAAAACAGSRGVSEGEGRYPTMLSSGLVAVGLLVLQFPSREPLHDPRNVAMRHLLLWLAFFYLIVSSSYSGGLASVLTVPRYGPPVDTLQDLADSDFLWGAPHEAYVYSIRDADEPVYETIVKKFRAHNETVLRHKSLTSAFGLPLERFSTGQLVIEGYVTEEAAGRLRVMKEGLYGGNIAMLLRKGSPLMGKLNHLIDSLVESGVVQCWEGKFLREFQSPRLQIAYSTSAWAPRQGPVRLRAQHVGGMLSLLCSGLVLSSAVFILEILTFRRKRSTY